MFKRLFQKLQPKIINPKIQALIKSLEVQLSISYNTLSDYYKTRISKNEHEKILKETISILKNNTDIQNFILETGKFRIKKEDFNKLPRTIQITTNKQNQLITFIEAKSKKADGKKLSEKEKKSQNPSGTFKTCKPSFIIPPIDLKNQAKIGDKKYTYVSLTSNLDKIFNLHKITITSQKDYCDKETEASQQTDAGVKLIHVFHYGKNQNKCTFYCEAGIPLNKYLEDKELYQALTPEHKNQIFYDIVNEIYTLHQNKIIHQDIKPENVIIYYDESNNKYKAKLHDFGVCSTIRKNAVGSIGFESPEIVESNFMGKYYKQEQEKRKRNYCTIATHLASKSRDKTEYTKPHEKNDMWSLGVIYLLLMHAPEKVKYVHQVDSSLFGINKIDEIFSMNDPWIGALLNPLRENRMSSAEAIQNIRPPETKTMINISIN